MSSAPTNLKELARAEGKKNYPKDSDLRAEINRQICVLIDQAPEFKEARRVALFAAMPWEVDLSRLWRPKPRSFVFPKVTSADTSLAFIEILSLQDLKPAFGGILEPPATGKRVTDWAESDLILVPGVRFDRWGGRIGTGAGYYDRFLAGKKARKWGVCFSSQLSEGKLAQESTDVRMEAVVTEKGITRIK